MPEPMPGPTPSPGGGRGTGRLSNLPTGVKVGGVVVLVAGAWFLWKKRQAAAAGGTVPQANASESTQGTALPGQSALSPLLNGYSGTGRITGYDSSGNPIMGVTPNVPGVNDGSSVGNPAPPPPNGTTSSPTPPPAMSPPPTPSAGIPTPLSPNGTPAPTIGSSGQQIGTYSWVSPGGAGQDPAGTTELTGYAPPAGVAFGGGPYLPSASPAPSPALTGGASQPPLSGATAIAYQTNPAVKSYLDALAASQKK